MVDLDECIGNSGQLYDFCQTNNLVDSVSLLNPDLNRDKTYIYGTTCIYYITISLILAESLLKAGHHQFHQHLIFNHKGGIPTVQS